MQDINIVFRPEWTCGRYNEKGEVAIFYNLLEGMSYLFEDSSALVVSKLLSLPRNGSSSVGAIAQQTGIAEESLIPFFEELMKLGLLINHQPDSDEINGYRQQLADFKKNRSQTVAKTTQEKLPMDVSSAEMDYTDKAGGIASVMMELTYNCSEKCIHCYNIGATRNDAEISHRGDLQELNLDDYKRIIDELYDEGLVKVCLSGGDPFSKPIAWDIIDYLYHKGVAFDVFTNGQRITQDVERLASYYPRLVGVSIYSGDEQTHDRITRIKGSWRKSMAVVKQLADLAVPMAIKCCIMKPNVTNYYTVSDIAKQLGAVVQYEINITDSIEGDKCASRHLRLDEKMLEVVLREDNIPMYVGEEAPNYGGQSRLMDNNACGAGYNSFCITPNGELIPCCSFHLNFGNLKEHSVHKIVHDNATLTQWQQLTLNDYEECGRHDYCAYCNLCAGNNYTEHGDVLKAGENNCFMAKVRYNLAKRMQSGYDPLHGKPLRENIAEIDTSESIFNALKREYE